MPEVQIECPETGRTIGTGVAMPESVFESVTLTGNETDCPYCERTHAWDEVSVVSHGEP